MSDDGLFDTPPPELEITAALKGLPDPPEPSHDFWPTFDAAIDAEPVPTAGVFRRSIPTRPLLAVAAILAVLAGGLGLTQLVGGNSDVQLTSAGEDEAAVDVATTSAESEQRLAGETADDDDDDDDEDAAVAGDDGAEVTSSSAPSNESSADTSAPGNDEDTLAGPTTSATTATTEGGGPGEGTVETSPVGSSSGTDETSPTSSGAVTTTTAGSLTTTSAVSQATTAPTAPPSSTEAPATTAVASAQLPGPELGRLAPEYGIGEVRLSVVWDPVPGATGYDKFYSLDGSDFVMSQMFTPDAEVTHRGPPGDQYCLRVIATSNTRPDSEPSVVCSVIAPPMNVVWSASTDYEGSAPEGTTMRVTWTDIGPAARYAVSIGWAARKEEFKTSTAQPGVTIDISGRHDSFCLYVDALDAGGNLVQRYGQCGRTTLG